MTSQPNDTVSRQPRPRSAPSPRDQQIYLDYQTGQRQTDLAAQYKLTQCRISQIIRRVQKWLLQSSRRRGTREAGRCAVTPNEVALSPGASGSPQPVGWASPTTAPDDSAARDHLQLRLQYDRLNEAARLALQHFHQPQKTFTHKTGTRAGKKYDETTERLLPPNLQCLKVVVQAIAQLTRLQASGGRQAPDHSPLPPQAPATPATSPNEAPLSRDLIEAWLTDRHTQAAREAKVVTDLCPDAVIRDVVKALLGEPSTGLALHTLARDAGKRVVQRRPYEDHSPPVPHRDGWYYGMYDADGGLVAWLHADQLSGAITPDYPPVSRPAPTQPRSASEGSPDAPAPSSTPTSSTSPSTADPPQPPSPSALNPASSQTQFPSPYEPHPSTSNPSNPPFIKRAAPIDITAHTLPQTGSFPMACICT